MIERKMLRSTFESNLKAKWDRNVFIFRNKKKKIKCYNLKHNKNVMHIGLVCFGDELHVSMVKQMSTT